MPLVQGSGNGFESLVVGLLLEVPLLVSVPVRGNGFERCYSNRLC